MKYLALFITLLGGLSAAIAQNISVTVDGNPVRFTDVGPRMMNGRVMVPLRGVLEALGAFVDYNSATSTVMAQKGSIDMQLKIGDRTALVSGRTVALDVPAMTISGRTMVPLRFMGESLGADVRWIDATQTVAITTNGGGGNTGGGGGNTGGGGGNTGGRPEITSFTHNGTGWLRPGTSLQVTMTGTPGGQASFRIPGIVDNVTMQEVSNGRYVGTWTPSQGQGINLDRATVLGQLTVNGQDRLIQAGTQISVDTDPPRVTTVIPEPNARVASGQVSISAVFDDGNGSGVDPSSIQVLLNGRDVTNQATRTASFVNVRPTTLVSPGRNDVVITARDKSGNMVTKNWSFDVTDASSIVKRLTHDAKAGIGAGDVITVRLEGQAGGQATFSVGRNKDLSMREESPGIYVGQYTVRRGEDLTNAPVVASLTVNGETYAIESATRINAVASALDAPQLLSPIAGSKVTSDFVVSGRAAPNTKVRVRVEYATTVLGALQLTGVVGEQLVDVDSNGSFTTESFHLDSLVGGSNTRYTIRAVSINDAGKLSKETVVRVDHG